MFTHSTQELENFKRSVDLIQLAASYGYAIDSKESCRTCVVMRSSDSASKIIVATAEDGHGIFFDVHGDAQGSAIDFVMYRENCNLGQARRILRDFTGKTHPLPEGKGYTRPSPVSHNRAELVSKWHSMKPYDGDYLQFRGLDDETIQSFSSKIRTDQRGNVCFRHDDDDGLSGWETKNRGFTGFSGGGKKSLFMCRIGDGNASDPPYIVITEAAIDAMSYAQLSHRPGLYVSFSGGLSSEQREQLVRLLKQYPKSQVITATDADKEGEKYAVFVHSIRPDAHRNRPGLKSRSSTKYKDWNDVLQDRPVQPPQQDIHTSASPSRNQQVQAEHIHHKPHEVNASSTPINWRGKGRSNLTPDVE
ncbi:MAG TPA: DUF3991 and toprim domain-containing protein [Ktedonosporobacter sp.]|jgi:hypothetical protein|nr:DUF3991 and toprim domain-containing protein [Ktedonosporobacter sp.]